MSDPGPHGDGPYATPREHALDEHALTSLLLARAVRIARRDGWLPGATADSDQIDEVEGTIRTLFARIETRLAAARDRGVALPMDAVRRRLGLTLGEQRALWALIGYDLDAGIRQGLRGLATEQGPGVAIGALLALAYDGEREGDGLVELGPEGRLARLRLIEHDIGTDGRSFAERRVRASRRALELSAGVVRIDPSLDGCVALVGEPARLGDLAITEGTKREVTELVRSALASRRPFEVIILTGQEGTGRRALAQAAAVEAGCSVLLVQCGQLPRDEAAVVATMRAVTRDAMLFGAAIVLVGIDELAGDVERNVADRIPWLDRGGLAEFVGPVLATCSHRTAPIRAARGCTFVSIPLPDEDQRRLLWARALGEIAEDVLAVVAGRYKVPGGAILRAGGTARLYADMRDGATGVSDVHEALRSVIDTKLGGLGMRIMTSLDWSDVVLPEDAMSEIAEMKARVFHRHRVFRVWGYERKVARGKGIAALFSGPPGTGKTLVATLLAKELGLDVYQIDLSRVVSKWVGETEKNLSAVFAAAESGHAILLFDEADALFTKRTEVKSSNDRYANLEVNYLLQRIEEFDGITILTTNHIAAIDEAFQRRLAFRIAFPMPEPEEREQLWRKVTPEGAPLADDVVFEELAEKYQFSGGHIRNVSLRAAFLAAAEGRPIAMEHFTRAATSEYAAMGKVTGR